MKKEHVVDEVKLAASSSLSDEKTTVMSQDSEDISLLCFLYSISFKDLVEKHALGVGNGLHTKVDLLQTDSQYNLRRDQKDQHAEYDVFSLNDLKSIAKVQ